MSEILDQFFGDAKRMRLSEKEKMDVRAKILAMVTSQSTALTTLEKAESFNALAKHMRRNPIPVPCTFSFFSTVHFHKMTASVLVAVLVLIATSGGVTYAAENAMPEDMLYTVKLHVNEPIRDIMHRDPEQRALWEVRKLERRMREAEYLSQMKGKFTLEHRTFFEGHMQKRLEHFQERLEFIPEERREDMQRHIEEKLQRHEEFWDTVDEATVAPEEKQQLKHHMQELRKKVRKRQPPALESERRDGRAGRMRTTRNRVGE